MSLRTNVALDQETYENLQAFCKDTGWTLTMAATLALTDWLEQVGPAIKGIVESRSRQQRIEKAVCINRAVRIPKNAKRLPIQNPLDVA